MKKRKIDYRKVLIYLIYLISLLLITSELIRNEKSNINNNINVIIDNNTEDESDIKNETKKITYLPLEEDPYADDAKSIQLMLSSWNYQREDGKKIAYLTFDDGPSTEVTPKILDILKKNDIKATFFILGSMVEKSEKSKENLIRIVDEGHAIGNHSYSHDYNYLYPNRVADAGNFKSDINKAEESFKRVLGEDFSTRVLRLPGGYMSWDTKNIDNILEEKYVYIDWNVLNGDGEGFDISSSDLLERLKETIEDLSGNDDTLVVLMHDTDAKETTVEYLQEAIDYLKELGYEFRTLK